MTSLNEPQLRAVRTGLLEIHRQLVELESLQADARTPSSFSEHIDDLSPTEVRIVRSYCVRLRRAMQDYLDARGLSPQIHRTSLRHALQMSLAFVSVEATEFRAERLRAYGDVGADARREANGLQQEIHHWLDKASTYLRQGLGRDLAARIGQLDGRVVDKQSLFELVRIIDHWQLLEFRPLVDALLTRWEDPQFEIAVFGRVSCGKSSLLNRLTDSTVLPVGVTPVTALTTRLVAGDRPGAWLAFAESDGQQIILDQLGQYVTEAGNPGNLKHLTSVLVRLPASRLREGVMFVDTPGIGSLARGAAEETFAYLPRCDLGLVLIDAGSTITEDDLHVLRLLAEAGTPLQVLLSKADLMQPDERVQMAEYIREEILRHLGLEITVHPVSTVGLNAVLLTRWFETEVGPLCAQKQKVVTQSLTRKAAYLRESVIAILQTLFARHQGVRKESSTANDITSERQLLERGETLI